MHLWWTDASGRLRRVARVTEPAQNQPRTSMFFQWWCWHWLPTVEKFVDEQARHGEWLFSWGPFHLVRAFEENRPRASRADPVRRP